MSLAQPPAADSLAAPVQVGTRASPLALVQTRAFIALITAHAAASGTIFAEQHIRTTGDAVQNRKLAEIGGKGLFAKEIHEAMLDGRIDLAVHSLKDLETALPPGIVLGATLKREDPRDALILGVTPAYDPADPFACLAKAALIGTSSVRRQAQLLHRRPDLRIGLLRGNVQTRLSRIAAGDVAATFLALAGLKRLGLAQHASIVLDTDAMLPSACQGIVGVTVRDSDTALRALLAGIDDPAARAAATAERALLGFLDGSCRTPIGGHARLLPDGTLHLAGLTAREDGSFLLRRDLTGAAADAERLGRALGASLRADSPADLFV
jgi:hydroxymethylbilane synthase